MAALPWAAFLLLFVLGATAVQDHAAHAHSPKQKEESIFSLGDGIFTYSQDVNLVFVIVVLLTVLLELGMHLLVHWTQEHSRLLVTHLNKELALLGIVAFILMTMASADLPFNLVRDLDVFEWCHVIIFFVALLTIASNLILNLILKWQERRFRMYELARGPTADPAHYAKSRLYLKFALARFVFECDRRKFFSTQSLKSGDAPAAYYWPVARPSSPQMTTADDDLARPLTSSCCTEPIARNPSTGKESSAAPPPARVASHAGANPGSHIVDADSLLGIACQTPCTPAILNNPLLTYQRADETADLGTREQCPPERCDESLKYLAEHLQNLRVTPLLANSLMTALQNRQSAAPDEFSFSEYLIRCARKELVKLLHVGWLAWAILLCVFGLYQLQFQYIDDLRGLHKVYVIALGGLLFSLYFSLWLWSVWSHRQCMKRLVEVAFLYFASDEGVEADGHASLASALTVAFPNTARRLQKDGLPSSVDARLRERQAQLYRRSIMQQKKSVWARFRYPRIVNLILQVLMMWMGFYFSVFLMTCAPRVGTDEWDLTEKLLWIPGLVVPLAFYCYFLPSIMFHHMFLVSVGDMIDLKVMRQVERERREKRQQHQRQLQRRRLMGRIRSKISIMAALKVDSWANALTVLRNIDPVLPLSLSLHLVAELRPGSIPQGFTAPPLVSCSVE